MRLLILEGFDAGFLVQLLIPCLLLPILGIIMTINKGVKIGVKQRSMEWKKHVTECVAENPDMIVRYEDMNMSPERTLKEIFLKLGVEVEDDVINLAIKSFNFKKLAGRKKGDEDIFSFFRKGIIGDWKNKFRDKDRRYFKEIAGDLLIDFGFEKDLNW